MSDHFKVYFSFLGGQKRCDNVQNVVADGAHANEVQDWTPDSRINRPGLRLGKRGVSHNPLPEIDALPTFRKGVFSLAEIDVTMPHHFRF
jgi:hypothetical protein